MYPPQVSAGTPLSLFVIYICIFAFMSPIGIGIGLTLSELATDGVGFSATTGILQGGLTMVKCSQKQTISIRHLNQSVKFLHCPRKQKTVYPA